eukprot:EG_transcript_2678
MEVPKGAPPEEDLVGQIFMSWIRDTHESPSRENFLRIQEVVESGCTEKQILLRSQRLGLNCATTIARMLDRTGVEKIDLYDNVIRDHGIQALAQIIRDSRTLTHLNFGANDLGPLACVYLAALLPSARRMKTLILGSKDGDQHPNRIDGEAAKALAEAVAKTRTVTCLDLTNNRLGQDGQEVFTALAKAVETTRALTTLRLGGTRMSTASAVALVQSVVAAGTMEVLDLHRNDLGSPLGEALVDLVGPRNASLHTLLLHCNPKLRTKGLVQAVRSLAGDHALLTLNLAATSLGDEGAIALATTLQANRTLTHVDLSENGITDMGALALCQSLMANTTLQWLGLAENRVRDEGACSLAHVLESSDALTHVDLSSVWVSDKGAVALAVALALNQGLQVLRLVNNHISDAAGLAISDLAQKNSTLLVLDLRGNQVSHSTTLRLQRVLNRNQSIHDGQAPGQLQQEVIRLHFQQYKLQESHKELKEQQRARLELQEQLDRTEREAMTENEATAKKSKDIIEKILLMDNIIVDLRAKQKLKEEETVKGAQMLEQELKLLQDRLKQEVHQREEKQREADELELKLKSMEKAKEERLVQLKEQIVKAQQDRDAWAEKQKVYRALAFEAQQKTQTFEAQLLQRQAILAAERDAKAAAKKEKAKKRVDVDQLLDALGGL